ncbi:T9SS type A sorting domain-containing protein [bacterium]|nr:T9SS type A sorting domain-containing protein [bacterium]
MNSLQKFPGHGFLSACVFFMIIFLCLSGTYAQKISYDFGDAPDSPYPTILKSNGARHVYNPDYFLGSKIDTETEGQPNAGATGDDTDGTDDEDGVAFTSDIKPGQTASVRVTASTIGRLNAWIDFNDDGDWADTGEKIFTDRTLSSGANSLSFSVPKGAVAGYTFARFRFSKDGKISFTGGAPEGEVEDYRVQIKASTEYDYGDAPDKPYPTKYASSGARHVYNADVFLGSKIDTESDGQPNSSATGDDTAGSDDEDGVTFVSDLKAGQTANITVVASTQGNLNAWIDFNDDGDWDDAGEKIYSDKSLSGGSNSLSFSVPGSASIGYTFARFRFSLNGGVSYRGDAADGEVEDYEVEIKKYTPPTQYDFGDAPDPAYPTKLSDGARHVYNPDVFLGSKIDIDADGQPNADATGDDTDGNDDEDGVVFAPNMTQGTTEGVTVTASTYGKLNAWVDFNDDGDWSDSGEQIFKDKALSPGSHSLSFSVPSGASVGKTFARFRFNLNGGVSYDGSAPDGEVEDYEVEIKEKKPENATEIDVFPDFCGSFDLISPTGVIHHVTVNGQATQAVFFEGPTEGMAHDNDADGREEVVTELLEMNLHGTHPDLGTIQVGIHPTLQSLGEISEHANHTTGLLDLTPFAPGDPADSFFDIYFEMEVGGTTLTTAGPKRVSGKISEKPPKPGEKYEDCTKLQLVDPNGQPTGYILGCMTLMPICTVEWDTLDEAGADVGLGSPAGASTVALTGPMLQAVYFEGPEEGDANDDDGDGLDEVHVELVSLNLTGESPMLGKVNLGLAEGTNSHGLLEEKFNLKPGKLDVAPFNPEGDYPADSFFDIFTELSIDDGEGSTSMATDEPEHLEGTHTEKPPAPGDSLKNDCEQRPLLDESGNATGITIDCFTLKPRLALDYGDAPDPAYPTLRSSGGASHVRSSQIYMGAKVDPDKDGQPHPDALGDDNDGSDDEDGVGLPSSIVAGHFFSVEITVYNATAATGYLNAWIDFNNNGNWGDAGEHVIIDLPRATGTVTHVLAVPDDAVPGKTFARFRYGTRDSISFMRSGGAGEVEDYRIEIKGDIPDDGRRKWSQPPTSNADSKYPGSFWGWDETSVYDKIIVADDWLCSDGRPVSDIHWWGSYPGWPENMPPPNAPSKFHLGIWTDVPAGADKAFSHPGKMIKEWTVPRYELNERIVGLDFHPDHMEMPDSCYQYDFIIPEGDYFNQEGDSAVYWISICAVYEEIPEEYQWGWKTRRHYFNDDAVRIQDPIVPSPGTSYIEGKPIVDEKNESWDMAFELTTRELSGELDFGDAPDGVSFAGYPTLLPSGAHHVIGGPWFGDDKDSPDPETNGQPHAGALGDDSDGNDDENGMTIPVLLAGYPASISIRVHGGGVVNAWIDFNSDKTWQAAEQIVNGFLPDGTHTITFSVPGAALLGQTFARFRINSIGALGPTGFAADGEVEDHAVHIREKTIEEHPRKWSQPPEYFSDSPYPGTFYGWDDISIRDRVVVADDWLCTDNRPVSDIHWWGSYEAWPDTVPPENGPSLFHIGIWKDVPAGADQEFSHPGEMVWEWYADRVELNERPAGFDFHPDFMEKPDACFQYDFYIPEEKWFHQEGDSNIYWISISALYKDDSFPEGHLWGWKTRKHYFNDDAVRIFMPSNPVLGSIFQEGQPIVDPNGNSWDMAFVLTTHETVGKHDLGDAPDSLNHFNAAMDAYPGVAARFPTVFQTTASNPHGPVHWDPRGLAYLGHHVTLEVEADQGPDEDPTNNIDPLNGQADLDLADDGVAMPLSLPHCQPTQFDFTVTVVNAIQRSLYVNVWMDWNRDGDWNDIFECGDRSANEWAVSNQLIVLTGPGVITFATARFLPWHPNGAEDTTGLWMRITLSETIWMPAAAGPAEGGAGPASGYRYGETEDYYFVPVQETETGMEYGDAPEGALAYPPLGVMGNFPTCRSATVGTYIEHGNRGWLFFGRSVDHESDGNGGFCPAFNPDKYNQDETSGDGDCGIDVKAYTIQGPVGSETVVPIIPSYAGPLGKPCEMANWGSHINLWWDNGTTEEAYINILFDWNQDGMWGGQETCPAGYAAPEHVMQNFPVPAATNGYLSVLSPPSFRIGPKTGYIWARFTITPERINPPWDGSGIFSDGETEDHLILISDEERVLMDFGDAPDSSMSSFHYPTRFADNGARHLMDSTIYLGSKWDPDADGQPQLHAKGDDNDGNDDEDGIGFLSQLIPGQAAQIVVIASVKGFLSAWVDFNQNGGWGDPSERIFNNTVIPQGNKQLSFFVPGAAAKGRTFARFRFSRDTLPGYTGEAANGEVEDYLVEIKNPDDVTPRKWSQPPRTNADSPHPTCFWGWDVLSVREKQIAADDWLCTDDRPITDIHWWGSYEGWDSDSVPNNAPQSFLIDIWTDVPKSADNAFSHPGMVIHEWTVPKTVLNERRVGCDFYPVNMAQPDACFKYDFNIPKDQWFVQAGDSNIYWISISAVYPTVPDQTRWGWKTTPYQNLDYAVKVFDPSQPTMGSVYQNGTTILDAAGNYWDLAFELTTNEVTGEFDFGDAPEKPYPTLSASSGAYHRIIPRFCLGNQVDPDLDGMPTPDAMGDDLLDGNDDEDGVKFITGIVPGSIATITVTASDSGYLNAWADFDGSGVWDYPSEMIFISTPLNPGPNVLTFSVPHTAVPDSAFARFRFSSKDTLWYTGYAPDGEVEDYWLRIPDTTSTYSIGGVIPETFALSQNYPNPFNPTTKIRFDLPVAVKVKITVYNLMGQELRILVEGHKQAGSYIVEWNGQTRSGRMIGTGIYLYRIEAGDFRDTKKFLFLK